MQDEAVSAFEHLCRRHVGPPWDLAYALTGHRADSADAVADAFVKVLTPGRPARFESPAELETALLQATRELAIEVARRPHPGADELGGETGGEGAGGEGDSRLLAFTTAFRGLPERWRTALWLTEFRRASVEEATTVLGVSGNGLAQLRSRALAALQDRAGDTDDLGAMLAGMAVPVPPTLVAMATSRWKAAANSATVVSRSRLGLLSFPASGRKGLAGAALAAAALGIIGAAFVSAPLLDRGRGGIGVAPSAATPTEVNQAGLQNPSLAQPPAPPTSAPPTSTTSTTAPAATPATATTAPRAASTAPSGGGSTAPAVPSAPTGTVTQLLPSGGGGLLPSAPLPVSTTLPNLLP